MKKLFALVALVFAIGMMVELPRVESPPDPIKVESTNHTDSLQVADLMPVYQVRSDAEVIRIGYSPAFVEDMTFRLEEGKLIPYRATKTPDSEPRLDKELDPGRCSSI
jgi:hypothetical protein